MDASATPGRPTRIAIVGSGPAGFYAAQALLKGDSPIEIDLFDRLPTPYGLVRHGVAPDHPKIKSVTAVYDRVAADPRMRFLGGVEIGRHVTVEELGRYYDQIVFSTGAQTDRRLGIPGEDLARSHAATEFVAWYNGHPDFVDREFDLTQEAAVVIGVGNVAIDVARILCRSADELRATDIADHALEALARSRVRHVYLVGRRGPAQAAFTNPEVAELGELEQAIPDVPAADLELDPASAAQVESERATARKLEILRGYVDPPQDARPKRLHLRFLVSPVELRADAAGGVSGVRLVRNRLVEANGRIRAEPTDRFEELDAGLVFRSVGYRGVPIPGLPFRDDWGIVPNDGGRVTDGVDGPLLDGLYVAGWIKRGPSGVIGTNKPDAVETVRAMADDRDAGRGMHPEVPTRDAIDALLASRSIEVVDFADWKRIDAIEIERGAAVGRPRLKLVRPAEFREALGSR